MGHKKVTTGVWYTVRKAAEVASANSGHPISTAYIRLLARSDRIASVRLALSQQQLYSALDVDQLRIERYQPPAKYRHLQGKEGVASRPIHGRKDI